MELLSFLYSLVLSLRSLVESYKVSCGVTNVIITKGGTLKYTCEICQVIIVCTTEDGSRLIN